MRIHFLCPALRVAEYSTGYPEPGKTLILDKSETIDLDNVPLNGGVLVKVLVLSIDPYLRELMTEDKSYAVSYSPFELEHASRLTLSRSKRSVLETCESKHEHPRYEPR